MRIAYRFLRDGEEETANLTYRELDLRARAYGAYLRAAGIAGEPVLLLFPPGREFIEAFFGCLYAGAIAVPAYPPRNHRGLPRVQAIVSDSRARAVLITAQSLSKTRALLDTAPGCTQLQYITPDTLSDTFANQWKPLALAGHNLAFLQYTSGSTASPKGVMVTHGNILANELMIGGAFQVTDDDIGVGWLPLFHDMGLIGHVLQPIYAGIPSILMSPAAFLQKPVRWLRAIASYGATISGGPNFAYELCLRKIPPEERATLDLSRWRVAYTGAEPVQASTLDAFSTAFEAHGFRSKAFLPCYGLAEATLMVSGGPADRPPTTLAIDACGLEERRVTRAEASAPRARRLVACGSDRPGDIPAQCVMIVNPETMARCAPDEIGEIWVAGSHVALGYWRRPDDTQATFRAYLRDTGEGPFLRTGDLGFLRDGNLVVTGRSKDLIILNGRNVYPHDIEWTVERSYAALQPGAGAAFSVEVDGQEQLVVAYELAPRERPDLEEMLGHIRQSVAEAHEVTLQHVVLVKPGTIPRTSSGKIQRRATRAQYLAGELQILAAWHVGVQASVLTCAPTNADETGTAALTPDPQSVPRSAAITEWLVTELARELRIHPSEIDTHLPFHFYGLASVEGVALAAKLAEWLGFPVPLSLVWDYPTIEAVSEHLSLRGLPA